MKGLVAEREAGGPYQSLADFCARLDARAVNKRQIENLARAGAFDSLDSNRRAVVEGADGLVRLAAAAAEERQSSQVNLFGESATALGQRLSLPAVADWPTMERLREEFGAIGFYLSAHPLEASAEALQRLGVVSYEDLLAQARQGPGRRMLAGILTGKQERTSRQGNRFAFLQLSDPSGVFEVVAFSEVLARARELLETGQGLLVVVETRGEGDELRLMAQEITRVEDAIAQAGGSLTIYFESAEPLASLKELLGRGEPGRGRVHLVLTLADGGEAELELGKSYRLAPQLRQAIKAIPGVEVMEA
jgi:DNA polymerase-3 subunit alpha